MDTNKIDLIKAEVARIQLYTQSEVLKQVLDYIDEVQKEPVTIKKGCKYRCLSDMVNKDTGNIAFIGDKIYLAPKDNALVSEENGWLCDTSENASNFELVEEPVSERFAFKAIPRLLEMIEPTDRAKAYIAKLADTLEVEGYSTDAKIVRACLKRMNGEKVPMATMNEEPVSEDLEYASEKYACRFSSSKYGHDKIKATFKNGANYVLDEIESILEDKELDVEETYNKIYTTINQLKK